MERRDPVERMKFKPRPALYFLIPYLLGIIVGRWLSLPSLWLWLSALLCLIGSLATRHRMRYLCYGLLHLAIFAGGMLRLETVSHSPIPTALLQRTCQFFWHHNISTRARREVGCLLRHRRTPTAIGSNTAGISEIPRSVPKNGAASLR